MNSLCCYKPTTNIKVLQQSGTFFRFFFCFEFRLKPCAAPAGVFILEFMWYIKRQQQQKQQQQNREQKNEVLHQLQMMQKNKSYQ